MKICLKFWQGGLITALFILALASLGQAQATRTWVSGVGDDANPCSRTAPCKTYAGAISKTAPGGEMDAIDPGGFGAVTITKSITIDGQGPLASILASGQNGIVINAGVNDVVTIRNISISGSPTSPGLSGIRIQSAKSVIIEDCVIFNFQDSSTGFGINDVRTSGVGNLFIKNTSILNNRGAAIQINPAAGSPVNATLNNLHLENTTVGSGLIVLSSANVTVRDSVISGNATAGIYADQLNGVVVLQSDNNSITNNGTGINTVTTTTGGGGPVGPGSPGGGGGGGTVTTVGPTVRLSNTMVSGNNNGLVGGNIFSYGNNKIAGNNAFNGPPSGGTIPQQ